jgi:hypothetical protein
MVYLAVTFYGTRVQRAEFNTDVSLHQHSSISLLRMAIRAVAKFRVIDMQEVFIRTLSQSTDLLIFRLLPIMNSCLRFCF